MDKEKYSIIFSSLTGNTKNLLIQFARCFRQKTVTISVR